MRTFLILKTSISLALLILSSSLCAQNETNRKIKIGVSAALSGGAATYGQDLRDAILFGKDYFNLQNYEFIFEDDRCSGKDAVTIANKFVSVDKVDFALGFACSSTAISSAPIYERAHIPTMVTCASSPRIAKSGKYIFRTGINDSKAASYFYKYLQDKHKKLGLIVEETDYCQDFADSFRGANSGQKLEIISESFTYDNNDFKPMLLKMLRKNIEGLLFISQTDASGVALLKQIRQLNPNLPLYTAYWPSGAEFRKQAGSTAEGLEYVDTPDLKDLLTPDGKALFAKYREKFPPSRSVESVWATTLEGLRVIDLAVKSKDNPLEFISKTRFSGVFGDYQFDADGEIDWGVFNIKRVVSGEVQKVE